MSDEQLSAREFLGQVNIIQAKIDEKKDRARVLREMATNPSPKICETRRAASPNRQTMEYLTAAKLDLEREIVADYEKWCTAYASVGKVISSVEQPKQRSVLELYYLDNRTFEQVSDFIGCSPTQVKRVHSKGLAAVEKILATA